MTVETGKERWLERTLLKTATLGMIALAGFCFGHLATASATQYPYSVIDLGPVDATEINNSGQVTGRGFVDQASMPFVTGPNGSNLRLISVASNVNFGYGFGINNLGQVTGFTQSFHPIQTRPFETAPNGDVAKYFDFTGSASDINDRGQVVGTAFRGSHDPPNTRVGLFLANMNDGSFKIVSSTVFSYDTFTHLNNLGQITGELSVPHGVGTTTHVFVTDPDGGVFHDISGTRDFSALAGDINNSGDVVGSYVRLPSGNRRAFVSYDGARRIDIGVLAPGGTETEAFGINDAGTIVGFSDYQAFIYTPGTRMQNLNDLIDPSLGIHLDAGVDVNERGQILAKQIAGHSYILTPTNMSGVPDLGSTGLLFVFALAGLLAMRQRLHQ